MGLSKAHIFEPIVFTLDNGDKAREREREPRPRHFSGMASSYVTFSTVTPVTITGNNSGGYALSAFTRRCVTASPNAGRRMFRASGIAKASTEKAAKKAMEYRKLGDSELNISEITMGTVRMRFLSFAIAI